jgi:hypothetical protein
MNKATALARLQAIEAHNAVIDRKERPPTGDDFNHIYGLAMEALAALQMDKPPQSTNVYRDAMQAQGACYTDGTISAEAIEEEREQQT